MVSRPRTLVDENGRVCTKCMLYKTWDEFHRRNKSHGLQMSYSECRDCTNARLRPKNAEKRRWLKQQAMARYGGFCACCGEAELTFLTIDHINNDGAQHRREVGNGLNMYAWLYKNQWPAGFQVLCWNCNLGRQMKGTCPHALGLAGLKEAG